jgi:cytochrome c-type biogenesis protein CcmH/NrfG
MKDKAMAWACYGRHASLQNENGFAIFALERALELGAEGAPVWIALGIARAHEKQIEGAIAAFQQAVKRNPDALDAWCMMAELAADIHQYDVALEAFKKCHLLDPRAETPHGARAKALARKTAKALMAAK